MGNVCNVGREISAVFFQQSSSYPGCCLQRYIGFLVPQNNDSCHLTQANPDEIVVM